jgi:CheY-like chemotaxis protein
METTHQASAAKLVVVIDDDPLILEGMDGLLRSWGFRVITAPSDVVAIDALAQRKERPDLIICDYHLSDGKFGTDAIQAVRNAYEIPAILISAQAVPERVRQVPAPTPRVMQKPVNPASLRRLLTEMFRQADSRLAPQGGA